MPLGLFQVIGYGARAMKSTRRRRDSLGFGGRGRRRRLTAVPTQQFAEIAE